MHSLHQLVSQMPVTELIKFLLIVTKRFKNRFNLTRFILKLPALLMLHVNIILPQIEVTI